MSGKFQFDTTHAATYATEKNADRAVERAGCQDLRHFMMQTPEGRWFPVFIGQEAVTRGVHFKFHVVG